MDRTTRILIAIDDSPASLEAVTYVSRLLGGRKDLAICLFHILPPIPPKLREFGGSEDPRQEERLSAELRQEQHQWTEDAKRSAGGSMDKAMTQLIDSGFSAQQVTAETAPSSEEPNMANHILRKAEEWDCGTIVVGRRGLSWLQELLTRHTGEDLVRDARNHAVWVVN